MSSASAQGKGHKHRLVEFVAVDSALNTSSSHSRQSSLSSLGTESILGKAERRLSLDESCDNSASPAMAILASSSPEIRELCRKSLDPSLLLPNDSSSSMGEECHLPPSWSHLLQQPQLKPDEHDDTHSTSVSTEESWDDYYNRHGLLLHHISVHDLDDRDGKLVHCQGYDDDEVDMPTTPLKAQETSSPVPRVSTSPQEGSKMVEGVGRALESISLYQEEEDSKPTATTAPSLQIDSTASTTVSQNKENRLPLKRPSLHRRVSFDMLPSMDQIATALPNASPEQQQQQQPSASRSNRLETDTISPAALDRRRTTGSVFMLCGQTPPRYPVRRQSSAQERRRRPRHRRNTTQIVLPK